MSGSIQVKDRKRGERLVRGLLKQSRKRAINDSLSEVPDAATVIGKLTKRVDMLTKRVKALEAREEEWRAKQR